MKLAISRKNAWEKSPSWEGRTATTLDRRSIAITGANGYIGRHLVDMALRENWDVIALSRTPLPQAHPRLSFVHYELESTVRPGIPEGVHAIIHLAARTNSAEVDDGVEQRAAELLLQAGKERGVPQFVFVSSQSARPDAPSVYGRIKHAVEERVIAHGGTRVRPGMVCGGIEHGGLYATLANLVASVPIVPRLIPSPRVQPIYVLDLCRALLLVASGGYAGELLMLAEEEPLRFDLFLQEIARHRFARRLRTIPLPIHVLSLALWFSGKLGMFATFSRARLASLTDLPRMHTADSLDRLQITLTPLATALGLHPLRRRYLLREGLCMLHYVGFAGRRWHAARHYVRAVETHQDGVAWDAASRSLMLPLLMAGAERRARRAGIIQLVNRFDIALAISESLSGYTYGRPGWFPWLKAVVQLSRAMCFEIVWRLLALLTPRMRTR